MLSDEKEGKGVVRMVIPYPPWRVLYNDYERNEIKKSRNSRFT